MFFKARGSETKEGLRVKEATEPTLWCPGKVRGKN